MGLFRPNKEFKDDSALGSGRLPRIDQAIESGLKGIPAALSNLGIFIDRKIRDTFFKLGSSLTSSLILPGDPLSNPKLADLAVGGKAPGVIVDAALRYAPDADFFAGSVGTDAQHSNLAALDTLALKFKQSFEGSENAKAKIQKLSNEDWLKHYDTGPQNDIEKTIVHTLEVPQKLPDGKQGPPLRMRADSETWFDAKQLVVTHELSLAYGRRKFAIRFNETLMPIQSLDKFEDFAVRIKELDEIASSRDRAKAADTLFQEIFEYCGRKDFLPLAKIEGLKLRRVEMHHLKMNAMKMKECSLYECRLTGEGHAITLEKCRLIGGKFGGWMAYLTLKATDIMGVDMSDSWFGVKFCFLDGSRILSRRGIVTKPVQNIRGALQGRWQDPRVDLRNTQFASNNNELAIAMASLLEKNSSAIYKFFDKDVITDSNTDLGNPLLNKKFKCDQTGNAAFAPQSGVDYAISAMKERHQDSAFFKATRYSGGQQSYDLQFVVLDERFGVVALVKNYSKWFNFAEISLFILESSKAGDVTDNNQGRKFTGARPLIRPVKMPVAMANGKDMCGFFREIEEEIGQYRRHAPNPHYARSRYGRMLTDNKTIEEYLYALAVSYGIDEGIEAISAQGDAQTDLADKDSKKKAEDLGDEEYEKLLKEITPEELKIAKEKTRDIPEKIYKRLPDVADRNSIHGIMLVPVAERATLLQSYCEDDRRSISSLKARLAGKPFVYSAVDFQFLGIVPDTNRPDERKKQKKGAEEIDVDVAQPDQYNFNPRAAGYTFLFSALKQSSDFMRLNRANLGKEYIFGIVKELQLIEHLYRRNNLNTADIVTMLPVLYRSIGLGVAKSAGIPDEATVKQLSFKIAEEMLDKSMDLIRQQYKEKEDVPKVEQLKDEILYALRANLLDGSVPSSARSSFATITEEIEKLNSSGFIGQFINSFNHLTGVADESAYKAKLKDESSKILSANRSVKDASKLYNILIEQKKVEDLASLVVAHPSYSTSEFSSIATALRELGIPDGYLSQITELLEIKELQLQQAEEGAQKKQKSGEPSWMQAQKRGKYFSVLCVDEQVYWSIKIFEQARDQSLDLIKYPPMKEWGQSLHPAEWRKLVQLLYDEEHIELIEFLRGGNHG